MTSRLCTAKLSEKAQIWPSVAFLYSMPCSVALDYFVVSQLCLCFAHLSQAANALAKAEGVVDLLVSLSLKDLQAASAAKQRAAAAAGAAAAAAAALASAGAGASVDAEEAARAAATAAKALAR